LPPGEEAELLQALEAALRPTELDGDVNERLLALALEDPLAPPSEEELIESARLRDALAAGTADADAGLLRALAAPFTLASADEVALERALPSAVRPGSEAAASDDGRAPRRNVVYALFGAASAVVAVAAAVALFVASSRSEAPLGAQAGAYVVPRSTAPLFAERFDTGDTTARMDLIASARGRELRDNRYASWGVR
jgi:hypothetical protein